MAVKIILWILAAIPILGFSVVLAAIALVKIYPHEMLKLLSGFQRLHGDLRDIDRVRARCGGTLALPLHLEHSAIGRDRWDLLAADSVVCAFRLQKHDAEFLLVMHTTVAIRELPAIWKWTKAVLDE